MKANLIGFFRFCCFLLLLPFLAALIQVFDRQIIAVGAPRYIWLMDGAGLFVLVYLFVYDFKEVYDAGHAVIGKLMAFAKPLAVPVSLVLPIYAVVVCIIYASLSAMQLLGRYEPLAVILVGFFWAMHVVLTAQHLREGEKAAIKGGYFFGFGLALVFHIVIAALLLAMAMKGFSLLDLVKDQVSLTAFYYKSIVKSLFVPSS